MLQEGLKTQQAKEGGAPGKPIKISSIQFREQQRKAQTLPDLQEGQEVPCVLSGPVKMTRGMSGRNNLFEAPFPGRSQILTISPGSPFSPCRGRVKKGQLMVAGCKSVTVTQVASPRPPPPPSEFYPQFLFRKFIHKNVLNTSTGSLGLVYSSGGGPP